mmetsp:Transcript_103481/g.178271  ORF Transcript_103481/g.178271 Transcript_103481/m.178271 type:complete len:103 (-) Transcript_103481:11-319(-)
MTNVTRKEPDPMRKRPQRAAEGRLDWPKLQVGLAHKGAVRGSHPFEDVLLCDLYRVQSGNSSGHCLMCIANTAGHDGQCESEGLMTAVLECFSLLTLAPTST